MSGHRPAGFTLIEVIVVIVLTAVAMGAILPFLGNVFMASHEPLTQMNEGIALQETMEDLVAGHTNSLESLRVRVGSEGGAYSNFTVLYNRYVEFPGGSENPAGTNLLKVTLQNSLGESITRLFARSLLEKP